MASSKNESEIAPPAPLTRSQSPIKNPRELGWYEESEEELAQEHDKTVTEHNLLLINVKLCDSESRERPYGDHRISNVLPTGIDGWKPDSWIYKKIKGEIHWINRTLMSTVEYVYTHPRGYSIKFICPNRSHVLPWSTLAVVEISKGDESERYYLTFDKFFA